MIFRKKIAIIGSGISGLSAAYFLKDKHQITVYEKNDRLGGHSRTIIVKNKKEQKINLDTGFIVLNDRTYPNLNELFKKLRIELVKTEMSFAVSANYGALEWSGTSIDSFFAQRKNIFNYNMIRGILDIIKFNSRAAGFVKTFPDLTLRGLIDKMQLKSWFQDYYILPMGGAIWSCPYQTMMDFPAATFVNFFENHGLLGIKDRPQWYTIKNKSTEYIQALENLIAEKGEIIKRSAIDYVQRTANGVKVSRADKALDYFDEVIFACHPSEILKILKDVGHEEKIVLEKFSKQTNTAYTHGDINQMPKLRKCWSSWNYIYEKNLKNSKVSVTYWMNKLQHIEEACPLFVTLNPIVPIMPEKIYDIYDFDHPVIDQNAITAQNELNAIQGDNRIWFCGAYLRYGFHEDGIWSAINVLKKIDEKEKC